MTVFSHTLIAKCVICGKNYPCRGPGFSYYKKEKSDSCKKKNVK
jgi:hypothetical protein